jgi:hypothetical protein
MIIFSIHTAPRCEQCGDVGIAPQGGMRRRNENDPKRIASPVGKLENHLSGKSGARMVRAPLRFLSAYSTYFAGHPFRVSHRILCVRCEMGEFHPCPFIGAVNAQAACSYELHFYPQPHHYLAPSRLSQRLPWLDTLILRFSNLRLENCKCARFDGLACRSTCALFARRSFAVKRHPSASKDGVVLVVAELQTAFSISDSPLKHDRLTPCPITARKLDFMRRFVRGKSLASRDTDHAVV